MARRALAAGALLVAAAPVRAAESNDGDIVSVYSSVSPAYLRTPVPGGGFKPESYAFGEGGDQGGPMKDPTIDRLPFNDVAHRIAPALAAQNYLPVKERDPGQTDLLIMVYWGTTIGTNRASSSPEYQIAQSLIPPPMPPPPPPPSGRPTPGAVSAAQQAAAQKAANDSALAQADILISMANRRRDRQNSENALTLGYAQEMHRTEGYEMTALRNVRRDIVDDVEENRYYVILLAYDFQMLWKSRQRKLLWETRFSVREQSHDFEKELAAMAAHAARYFGQNSGGLVRKPMPTTNVKLGELKVLEAEPEPAPRK